jgi:prophage regulatory protein
MDHTIILRLNAVKERTGLSRSCIYKLIAAGNFPKPISLSVRAVGWDSRAVEAFLTARIQASLQEQANRDSRSRL